MESVKPQPPPISEAVAQWLIHIRRLSTQTQQPYRRIISCFLKFLPEDAKTIADLRPAYIERYIDTIIGKYCAGTINNHIAVLKSFHRWLSKNYDIPNHAQETVMLKYQPEEGRTLSWDEYERVLAILSNIKFGEPKQNVFISTALNEYFDYIKTFSKITRQRYRHVLSWFVAVLPEGVQKINDIDIEHKVNFVKILRRKYTKQTIQSYIPAIKSFYRWLDKRYGGPIIPTKTTKTARQQQHFDIIRFLANTGIRAGELISIKWRDLSPDLSMLTIPHGKGGKRRYIPLNAVCKELLSKYELGANDDGLPFVTFRNRKTLYRMCARLAKKARIPMFGPHALRHLFATQLIEAGVPLFKVSKILGHSSQLTTEKVYVHLLAQSYNGITEVLAQKQQGQKEGVTA